MGYEMRRIEVGASISRHNSEQDRTDDKRWEDLRSRIAELANDYQDIAAWVT